jgi:hypothetical protein
MKPQELPPLRPVAQIASRANGFPEKGEYGKKRAEFNQKFSCEGNVPAAMGSP